MTLRVFLTAYPWDLLDGDLGATLDRLHGEVGVTGVSVWVGLPPITHLRMRDVEPRVFRTRGGLFFHPDEQHYVATRCKPIVSSWHKTRNPLATIAESCLERALELRVILSAAATGRIAQRHPEMACKSAFGGESHLSVCLANPDVQTYLCGVVTDLSSNYEIKELTIADFALAWAEASAPELRVAAPPGETERSLLSTCFCESCHQRAAGAGVDVAAARRTVRTLLQSTFESGTTEDQRLDTVLPDNTPLAEYGNWRAEELASLGRSAGVLLAGIADG